MSKYVILANWTDQGIRQVAETVTRADQFKAAIQQAGGSVDSLVWTMGRYDVVAIVDLPDDETASKAVLKVGATGSIRGETLRAFTAEEVAGIVSGLGSSQ